MSKGKWLNNVARLIKKKDKEDGSPGGYFLEFGRRKDKDGNRIGDENPYPLVINEGDIFQARVKKDELQKLVDKGDMTQEVADKISKHEKFEFSIAPKDETEEPKKTEGKKPAAKSKTKSQDSDEVDF